MQTTVHAEITADDVLDATEKDTGASHQNTSEEQV
jgi:hypothetical protein